MKNILYAILGRIKNLYDFHESGFYNAAMPKM